MSQPLRFSPFLEMLPRTAERLLPDGMAVEADNLEISSGEIRALRAPLLVHAPSGSGPWYAVYRAEKNGAEKWLAWNKDVDVVKGQLTADVDARYYWTGDNEPRFSTYDSLPATIYSLGIPSPQSAPGASHSGGTGSAASRIYAYTYFSALGEESGPSPACALTAGKVDGTWAITGMNEIPINSSGAAGVFASGSTTFNTTGAVRHWLRAGDEIVLGGTKVVVTEVPSASSFKVLGDYSAITSWSRAAPWNTVGMKRRLYRSAGTLAGLQLVADDVGTTYNDTLTDAQIPGDDLISLNWELPPVGLRGLFIHPSGALGGFVGTRLRLSEPLQGHAWPTNFEFATDSEIVGAQTFGNSIVAATATRPYVYTGQEPESLSPDTVDEVWPCLSKRSVVSLGDGVAYATSHGIAYVGLRGRMILTDGIFIKEQWDQLDPSSMVGSVAEGKLFMRWVGLDGSKGIMVFAIGQAGMRRLSDCPDELYADPRNGRLYMVTSAGVAQYNAATGARLNYAWKSKEHYLPTPTNYGAIKIDFTSEISEEDFDAAQAVLAAQVAANAALVAGYKGTGGLNGAMVGGMMVNGSNIGNVSMPELASVTFSLIADGKLIFSRQVVAGYGLIRPPAGKKYQTAQIALNGNCRVKAVRMAETPADLARVP